MSVSQIAWDDTVLPFQLDQADTRGRVARLDGVFNAVLKQHDYPDQIEALVAEAVLLTVLIGQAIKLRWKLSLQIRGNGPARLIATDYYGPTSEGEPARVRAYASFDRDKLGNNLTPFQSIGKGYFAVLMDQGEGNEPYQGITPLAGNSLANCAQTYFEQSEQIPTRFNLAFGKSRVSGQEELWRGGGIMVQHMPKTSPLKAPDTPEPKTVSTADDDSWNRINYLLDTVEEIELAGPLVQPTELLVRLFNAEGPRVFESQPVAFGCTCSPERVKTSLSIYSAKDIAHMTTEDGKVTADCQFCGAHYEFSPEALGFEANDRKSKDA